jgi:hypothetical protein
VRASLGACRWFGRSGCVSWVNNPDETLAMLTQLVLNVCNSDWTPDDDSDYSIDIASLWSTFEELDQWLSKGGHTARGLGFRSADVPPAKVIAPRSGTVELPDRTELGVINCALSGSTAAFARVRYDGRLVRFAM